jgi:hypothetical protein
MKEIVIKLPCKAFVSMGCFTSNLASSLAINTTKGIITNFDEETKYVEWTNEAGVEMPSVHINMVAFNLK